MERCYTLSAVMKLIFPPTTQKRHRNEYNRASFGVFCGVLFFLVALTNNARRALTMLAVWWDWRAVLMGCSALQMHGDSRALSLPLAGKVSLLAPVLLAAGQPYHAPRSRPTPEGDVAPLGTPVQPPGAGEGTQEEHMASETAHSCVVMKLPPLNEGASSHC